MDDPVVETMVVRCGGAEAATEQLNARISKIEAELGVPASRSRATVHPTTLRKWANGRPIRFPVVQRALSEMAAAGSGLTQARGTVNDVDRRQFLVGAGTGALCAPVQLVIADLGAAPAPDPDQYEQRAAHLWRDPWACEPIELAYAAADHAERGRQLVVRSQGADRRRIADAAGLVTILVGRTAFFDLGRPDVAERVWDVAADQLAGSSDSPLLACLHGHRAFVPGWAGRWQEAHERLRIAAGYGRRGGGPVLRSWLHAVAAECLTRCGQPDGAIAEIAKARATLAAGGAHPDPWWLDYFDAERLDGFDATAALASAQATLAEPTVTGRAGRHAQERIERALGHFHTYTTGLGLSPQGCVTALDRATAYAVLHDDERALVLAEAACQALGRRPYHAAIGRLETLRVALAGPSAGRLHEIETTYLWAA